MHPTDFWMSLYDYIQTTHTVIPLKGPDVTAGEEFTLRFRVANHAPIPHPDSPTIVFRDCHLNVTKGAHARPAGSNDCLTFLVGNLGPGQSRLCNAGMVATSDITSGDADSSGKEDIAVVHVNAKLDIERFFEISKRQRIEAELFPVPSRKTGTLRLVLRSDRPFYIDKPYRKVAPNPAEEVNARAIVQGVWYEAHENYPQPIMLEHGGRVDSVPRGFKESSRGSSFFNGLDVEGEWKAENGPNYPSVIPVTIYWEIQEG